MNSKHAGKISSCPKNGCNYHCCDFNQGNYIVLLPNELDHIKKTNKSHKHLHIIGKLENNSHKVVCKAKDRKNCDKGYKPIDCRIYPLFPKESNDFFIKGKKCPLSYWDLNVHKKNCTHILNNLPFCNQDDLRPWYGQVSLVDYEDFTEPPEEATL